MWCVWWWLFDVGEGSGSWVDDGSVDGDCDVASDGDDYDDGCLKYMDLQL